MSSIHLSFIYDFNPFLIGLHLELEQIIDTNQQIQHIQIIHPVCRFKNDEI